MSKNYGLGLLFVISLMSANIEAKLYELQPNGRNFCTFRDTKFTCDCGYADEERVLPRINGNAYEISVLNCKKLKITANTLNEIYGLRRVNFRNIENLYLETNSLTYPRQEDSMGLILEFISVKLEEISSNAIHGNIDEIIFENSSIGRIRAFALTALSHKAFKLVFDKATINYIDSQAFKKFNVEHLEIKNSVFQAILPTRSFYDLEVTGDMLIENSVFHELNPKAFNFKSISRLTINKNQFKRVNGEFFEANIKQGIAITNNEFGPTHMATFKGLAVDKSYSTRQSEKMDLRFFNNTIQYQGVEPNGLIFDPDFNMQLKGLYFSNNFTCQYAQRIHAEGFFTTHSDAIYFRLENTDKYLTVSQILTNECVQESYSLYIALGVSAIILILLIILTTVIVICLRRRRKRKLDVVVPEPRTYRETQIVLQIENAGLLKTDM